MPPSAATAHKLTTPQLTTKRYGFSGVRGRLVLLGLLIIAEFVMLTMAVDTESLRYAAGIAKLAGAWGPWGLRCCLLAGSLSVVFAIARAGALLDQSPGPVRAPYAVAHLAIYAVFGSSAMLLVGQSAGRDVLALVAAAAGLATFISGALTLLPASFWTALYRNAPQAPLLGSAAATATLAAFELSGKLAERWLYFTFQVAYLGLRATTPDAVADWATATLGTSRFQVTIAPECSGYEGLALMLAFGAAWLWFFRRELRFPQALLLIPGGMAVITVFNWTRVVVLILIGSAGAPNIATGGFHSQAGWIGFMITAILFCMACQRLSWIAATPAGHVPVPAVRRQEADPTTAYLLPFLSILAFGILAQAASAGFEWLYPLRVVAAAGSLWWSRRVLQKLDWRMGWAGLAIGCAVWALWIGIDRLLSPGALAQAMPAPLAGASAWLRVVWLAFRVVGGVVTVPIAEELAFRGFLLRRLIDPAFEAVDPRRFTWLSFGVSSLLFGVLHGRLWFAGVAAGMMYAWVYQRRGRIGEAMLAHGVTNALLAVGVLLTGDWRLW